MISDLHVKVSDVLGKYLKDVPLPEEQAIALVDELVNLLAAQQSVQSDECDSCHDETYVTLGNGSKICWYCGRTRR
jgi:hypothetical protein